ncbi:MAG: hypothetical protein Fur0018_13220 [Anaerolineales bacterium]
MDSLLGKWHNLLSRQTSDPWEPYQHAHFALRRRILRRALQDIGFTLLAKLDSVHGLENVPASGPALLLINHIAFIDPIVVMHVVPRNVVPMAKIEVYDYPLVGLLPRLWGVIPVRRGEADRRALRMALQVLRAGEMVLVAPEGTRSPALQRAKEGIVYLALQTGAPIVPVAIEGTPGFPVLRGSKRWKAPGAQVQFGRPFRLVPVPDRPRRAQLRQMSDEAMCVLAKMLPPERRGVYANEVNRPLETVVFLEREHLAP